MAVYFFFHELSLQFNLFNPIPQCTIILTSFVDNGLQIVDVFRLNFIENRCHLCFAIFDDLFPLQSIDCPCKMLIDNVRAKKKSQIHFIFKK